MPSPLEMRIQLLEYIVAIKRRNYDSKSNSTLAVIPNVFNQFDKGWKMKPFRSLFGNLSPQVTRFIPEFEVLMTHVAELSSETLAAFDKYGELRAGLLAMLHVRNKKFLIEHFEEIFVFLEHRPDRLNTRNQIIAYLLSESSLKTQELEELLKNIFSPILKQEVMMQGTGFIAVAAREAAREAEERTRKEEKIAAEKAKLAALQLKMRTLMMRSWKKGISADIIADIVELKKEEVDTLLVAFERGKAYFDTQTRISSKKMMKITDLTEEEVAVFMKLLKEKK